MNDLYDFGIRGRLAYFISAFLNERQFRVRVGNTFSRPLEQEMGVPQGCILSMTLFSVYCQICMSWCGMFPLC